MLVTLTPNFVQLSSDDSSFRKCKIGCITCTNGITKEQVLNVIKLYIIHATNKISLNDNNPTELEKTFLYEIKNFPYDWELLKNGDLILTSKINIHNNN